MRTRAAIVVGCCSLLALPASSNAQANHRPAAKRVAAAPETLGGLCRKLGTAEQCGCYVPEVQRKLSPSQITYLERYLRFQIGYKERYRAALAEYQRQRPLAGAVEGMAVGLSAYVGRAQEADRDNNALARDMGGAEPFYKMTGAHDDAVKQCDLGGSGPSPQARAAQAQKDADLAAAKQREAESTRQALATQAAESRAYRAEVEGEHLRLQIGDNRAAGAKLTKWSARWNLTPNFTNKVIDTAAGCLVAMRTIQWTPPLLEAAKDPQADFRQMWWSLNRNQPRWQVRGGPVCPQEVHAVPFAGFTPGGNPELTVRDQLTVWFLPIPLMKTDQGWAPVMGAPTASPTATGLRMVVSVSPSSFSGDPREIDGLIIAPG